VLDVLRPEHTGNGVPESLDGVLSCVVRVSCRFTLRINVVASGLSINAPGA
jgi:hypothetical protein